MKNKNCPSLSWATSELPEPINRINFYCRMMNLFGRLPFPFNKIAKIYMILIKNLLFSKSVDFSCGCNILFGNLNVGSENLSNSYGLDISISFYFNKYLISQEIKRDYYLPFLKF